jgi:rhodanese-related sulfurtransferase
MKAITAVFRQTIFLIVLGVAVGLGVNAVRGKDRIQLSRDYTPTLPRPPGASGAVKPAEAYQAISLAGLVFITENPARGGLDLVLDARRESAYLAGHIPGAVQCDPYNLDAHINEVLGMALGAERVIVYCNGGACEDSILLGRELELRGIPKEQIYLFHAGWEGWRAYQQQQATAASAPADTTQSAATPAGGKMEVVPQTDANEPPTTELQGFHVVDLERAVEMFQDLRTENGTYVFVDARADEPYTAGHIPGAVQCDYYRIDYYFPDVMQVAANAEKIVVYCNGGDCEDSLYVCGELLKADIPRAHILLFKGGWQEWTKGGMPVETGRE